MHLVHSGSDQSCVCPTCVFSQQSNQVLNWKQQLKVNNNPNKNSHKWNLTLLYMLHTAQLQNKNVQLICRRKGCAATKLLDVKVCLWREKQLGCKTADTGSICSHLILASATEACRSRKSSSEIMPWQRSALLDPMSMAAKSRPCHQCATSSLPPASTETVNVCAGYMQQNSMRTKCPEKPKLLQFPKRNLS